MYLCIEETIYVYVHYCFVKQKLRIPASYYFFPVISTRALYHMLLPNIIGCFFVWRADEKIHAIRDNVFPPQTKVDASEAANIIVPAKIEERSISSLVETPKMAPKLTKMTISANKKKVVSKYYQQVTPIVL